jgi:hypothetical protein
MKKILTLFLIVLASFANAQDTIHKTDGNVVVGKITEINNSDVKFKMYNSDISVTESKSNIHHIVYTNGLKEFYNTSAGTRYTAPENTTVYTPMTTPVVSEKKYGNNIISLNFFETIFTNFGVSYERILPKGNFSFKIPLSFGLGSKPFENNYNGTTESTDYMRNKIFGTGLEFNIYPIKAQRSGFYVGLSGEYGEFNYFQITYPSGNGYTGTYSKAKYVGKHYAGLFHLGGFVGLTDNLLLGGKMAVGYKRQETILDDYTRFKCVLDLTMSYRF